MLQIDDTLVSLDLIERYFVCDLEQCKGECCIEGDAGAPITPEESDRLAAAMPVISDELLPAAKQVIEENGVSYIDDEGDLVTSIVDGCNCVFTCYGKGGICLCLLEKAYREGKMAENVKPSSCRLYPVRVTQYDGFRAVNLHRWKICKSAERNGRRLGVRAYEFLKQPLTDYFGADWYAKLELTARAWLSREEEAEEDK